MDSQELSFCPPLDYGGPVDLPKRNKGVDWLNKSIWEHFRTLVSEFPQNLALDDGKNQLSYLQVEARVIKLVAGLNGLDSDRPVAIVLPYSVYYPMAMLACLAAGIPYLPFDSHIPS
jgi:acyl-CoA synthetase (AMP-forming)/AMP-acid ligase II